MVDAFDGDRDVKEVAEFVYEEYRDRYPARTAEVDTHYYSLRRSRQVLNAALCEVAWRDTVASMDSHYQKTGSLIPDVQSPFFETEFRREPILHRFVAIMEYWFGGTLQQALEDLRQDPSEGNQYHYMHDLNNRYVQAFEDWRWNSSHPKAKEVQKWRKPSRTQARSLHKIVRENMDIVAGQVIGVGLASEGILSAELDEKVLKKLERVSDVTSLVKPANTPYFEVSAALREAYSKWERGEMTAEEFCSLENYNDTDGSLHPSLYSGPLENDASACAGKGSITRPERFPVSPDTFFRRLGAKRKLGKTTLASLTLIPGFALSRETIFTNWPK